VIEDVGMAEEPEEVIKDSKEAIKLCFESLKQIVTLSSGAIVIIGTLLKNIFPVDSDGTPQLTSELKVLIAGSFLFFGLSLAVSAIATDSNVILMKDVEERRPSRSFRPFLLRVLRLSFEWPLSEATAAATRVALWLFSLGVFCFGLAVFINLR
jgi:hypothetical protein